jgi:hypothetical protein
MSLLNYLTAWPRMSGQVSPQPCVQVSKRRNLVTLGCGIRGVWDEFRNWLVRSA